MAFYPLVFLAAQPDTKLDVFGQVLESKGMVLAVLIVLVALSIACWFIIGLKTVAIARAITNTRRFIQTFRSATRLAELYQVSQAMPASPARDMFRAGYEELDLILREREGRTARPRGDGPAAAPESASEAFENIERSLLQAAALATSRLERMVSFLATVGSAAPFIGLFGTVWGIMNAFGDIDPNLPILQTVTPHIAEALVATAIGLLAAIPAVMAYNFLVGRMKQLEIHLDDFSTDYLNILRRHFFS
jgi:biopolymer transport protein TolQ